MKKLINIGTAVDVGDGDYLRLGGQKINDNFNDIYYELGDNNILHSAGSWKIIDEKDLDDKGYYNPVFGQSLIVNTTVKNIKMILPKGGKENIGKVIKLRDVFGTWATHVVEIKAGSGDTIKGQSKFIKLDRNFMTIELVYTAKNRWEYVETTQIDKNRSDDLRSVVMNEFVAYEGQTDFPRPFGVDRFNPDGLEVYRRGNRLFYGKEFSSKSEYGSIGETGELVKLNGETIKLREPCVEGDTIAFVSYIDGIETFRTSYSKRVYQLINLDKRSYYNRGNNDLTFTSESYKEDEDGVKYIYFSLIDLDIQSFDNFNPYAFDIYLNGVMLTKNGDIEDSGYYCKGDDISGMADSPLSCAIKGGEWVTVDRTADFNFVYDGSDVIGIEFNFEFNDKDILSINWYSNIIGTTLSVDEIRNELDSTFFNSLDMYYQSNKVSIPNYEEIEGLPKQEDVKYHEEVDLVQPNSVNQVLDMVYPIGHIYMNLYNKESPELTLGFGKWRRLSGYVLAGFNEDYSDSIFGQNNNIIDNQGNPVALPGGTYGSLTEKLSVEHIPKMTTDKKYLSKDPNGEIEIGSCLDDPEEEITNRNRVYSEKTISMGTEESKTLEFNVMQPTMVVSMWVRVA